MDEATKDVEIKYTQIFINNDWVDSINGKTFDLINPATAEKVCKVQEGDKDDIDVAVSAAREAFRLGSKWRTMDASVRGLLIHKLANLIERDMHVMVSLMGLEAGKVLVEGYNEVVGLAIPMLRYMAGWTDKIHGKTVPSDGLHFTYTRTEPVGVVGLISPWNFPLSLLINKVSAAMATGCTMVVKPAEQTPLVVLHLASLVAEAGFPPGVFNVVPGFGPTCGEPLTSHMDVDKVSFTGSTEVGQLIQSAAGHSNSKRVTLEMGGKNALVVAADFNVDEAVMIAHIGCFYNGGQVCIIGSRVFVHEDIHDEFVEKSRAMALARVVGDPFDQATQQGPLVSREQFEKVLSYIESGKTEGANLECGGEAIGEPGFFIQPTIFTEVKDDMTIAKEEIFGPVQVILKYSSLSEVIERANNTKYGLSAGILTNNIKTAFTFTHSVRAGILWINTYLPACVQGPFGGYKMSGIGREGGYEGLLPYLETKTVTIKVPTKNS